MFINDCLLTCGIEGFSTSKCADTGLFGEKKSLCPEQSDASTLLYLVCISNHLLRLLSDWIAIHLECFSEGICAFIHDGIVIEPVKMQ